MKLEDTLPAEESGIERQTQQVLTYGRDFVLMEEGKAFTWD